VAAAIDGENILGSTFSVCDLIINFC